ncbi:DUF885 domain-containing protein [Terricaulis sp.]|uniref:DUF885 domain-containing protein n=1 Tax=Terricaulis sp. TaxID=2768686 RepID=UPI002AC46572|nr:DUF885 family protein [Terricaulis sp.]MDZ4691078.1 DUF885 family protein [Terricaulis sp.]
MQISRRALLGAGAAGAAVLSGCATSAAPTPPPVAAAPTASAQLTATLDRTVAAILRESPERCTALGLTEERAGYRFIDKLSDASKASTQRYRAILQTAIGELSAIDRSGLSAQENVTVDVVTTSYEYSLANSAFSVGGGAGAPYVVTQLTGSYGDLPDFLDSQHPLRTRDEADAYLARLSAYVRVLDQETAIIREDAAAGVIPPDFAIDRALDQMNTFTSTAPAQTVLVQTLVRRLPNVTEISEAQRANYISQAESAVRDAILPAYERQKAALREVRRNAVHDAGIWRLPQGAEMYAASLRSRTTTTMSPDEIHEMGVDLIRGFHSEMDTILRAQGLTRGSVAQRVQQLSRRPDQLYPNTDAGRTQILADLTQQTREIEALMPRAFNTLAQAQLEIRRVPPTTEAGAPGGYYQRAALDGSRPGAYYINLRDTREWPRFTLPTLNYHEGVPGHHWQISIQQESGSIPFIRSAMLGFSAFSEGWGLYAEQLADELGVYDTNQLGRLGYLQSMTFRASRLVVDTGIHHKRWSREQAIASMVEATGDQESSITTEIERYCVWPGQACSYMVGRQAINRMRDASRTSLGDRFDLKAFHDTMLANGAVPLSVLERIMADWTTTQRA